MDFLVKSKVFWERREHRHEVARNKLHSKATTNICLAFSNKDFSAMKLYYGPRNKWKTIILQLLFHLVQLKSNF